MPRIKFSPPLNNLSEEAIRGLQDLFYFGKNIWGLEMLSEKPHRQMADDLMEVYGDGGKDFLMNRVPRDCFKTTFASVCFASWVQLKEIYERGNYYYRIFFNAATKEKSWAIIQKIMDKWEYDTGLQKLYGNLRGKKSGAGPFSGYDLSPKFTTGDVSVVSEPNFFCGSEISEQTGKHSDMNIHDDLSEQKNSQTRKRREKVIISYKNSLSILKKDGGKQVMNCTAWHDADVSSDIISRETRLIEEKGDHESRWKIRNNGAILPDGTLYFPDRLGLERLEQLRHELGPAIFASQYLNDPAAVGALVRDEQIKFKKPSEIPKIEKIRVTIDPAFGDEEHENGDFYWITVGGFDQFNTLYVLDVRYGTDWGTTGFVDQLFGVARDFPDYHRMFIEASHRDALISVIHLEEAKRGDTLRLQYVPRQGSSDKYTRWLRFQPRFENGRIFFNDAIPLDKQSEIKDQLLRAPYGDHDDFLDTLADMEIGIKMIHASEEEMGQVAAMQEIASRSPRMVYKMRSVYNPATKRYEGELVPATEGFFRCEDLMR